LVAVPWSAVSKPVLDGDRVLVLKDNVERIKAAPRLKPETLFELTKPALITQVTNYYATAQNKGQPGSADQKQKSGGQDASAAKDDAGKTAAQKTETADAARPQVLVGRSIVTVLAPPALLTVNDVRGTEVESTTGETLGEIEQVILDLDRGRVAYLLMERGGFLGLGGEWAPVPLGALAWSTTEGNYTLKMDEAKLKELKTLPRTEELPRTINANQLEQLYNRFGVKPYWS
jgi:hypothetical protein